MDAKELKKYNEKKKIDYKELGLKKTYYEPGETPQERLRNILSPTVTLAEIIENEGHDSFKRLHENKQLQDIVKGTSGLISKQYKDIQDYLHDIPIFYKHFDQEGNKKNFKNWLENTFNYFFT